MVIMSHETHTPCEDISMWTNVYTCCRRDVLSDHHIEPILQSA